MSSSGKGDANSYWPGFVDALTNVVIAMIFVVVVLAISLSFAAQLMAKKMAEQYIQEHSKKSDKEAPPPPPPEPPDAGIKLNQRIAVAGNEKPVAPKPSQLKSQGNVLQLDYAPGAVTLDAAATGELKKALAARAADIASLRVQLVASGPDMAFTDNQRAAFLRVMDVRNALIDAGFSADRIEMNVDTQREARAPAVNLRFSASP